MERERTIPAEVSPAIVEPVTPNTSRLLNRRRFLTLAVGLSSATLLGCSTETITLTESSAVKPSATEASVALSSILLPPVAVAEDAFDYCAPSTPAAREVAQALSGTSSSKQEVVQGPSPVPAGKRPETKKDEPDQMSLTDKNIIRLQESPDPSKIKALLIPVGYQTSEITPKMTDLITGLDRIYQSVKIEFPFLDKAVSLRIDHVHQIASLNDPLQAEKLIKKLQQITPLQLFVFVINTNSFIGTSYSREIGTYSLLSGNGPRAKATAAHEIAHGLGLSDGYRDSYLGYQIPNEELFPSIESLPPHVREAFEKELPTVVATGGRCSKFGATAPLYTVYSRDDEETNIMKIIAPTDAQIETAINRGKMVFDPVQIAIMNSKVKRLLAA